MPAATLSDPALGVFAFAAYHQLTSGETVVDVALHDGAGHAADGRAIGELEAAGLVTRQGDRAAFTDAGRRRLNDTIASLRASR